MTLRTLKKQDINVDLEDFDIKRWLTLDNHDVQKVDNVRVESANGDSADGGSRFSTSQHNSPDCSGAKKATGNHHFSLPNLLTFACENSDADTPKADENQNMVKDSYMVKN